MAAVLVTALMATPQFKHHPPVRKGVFGGRPVSERGGSNWTVTPLLPLVRVLFSVEPEMRYTSVLLATQTVSPVTEFDAHELTGFGVEITAGVPPPSMGTTWIPVWPSDQEPFGT